VSERISYNASFRASVASRGISIGSGKRGLSMEIPRLPSVAALLSVARNDGETFVERWEATAKIVKVVQAWGRFSCEIEQETSRQISISVLYYGA